MEREANMRLGSVIFKSLILLGLLFILASVLWGMAHREGLSRIGVNGEFESQYRQYRPAAYTSYILVALVGIGIVVLSISLYKEIKERGSRG